MSTVKTALPSVEPLFIQIEKLIEARILNSEWTQGEALPSEFAFADYYDVSQGTARKAINLLAERNLLERRQGKGTFVKSLTIEREHSHFFHIINRSGEKLVPSTTQLSVKTQISNIETNKYLNLHAAAEIIVIERLRLTENKPQILELIIIEAERFPGLDRFLSENTENELYPVYEQLHGVRILRAEEEIKAVAATKHQAKLLEVSPGTPLLEITRIAHAFDDEPVELRKSWIDTKDNFYQSLLY